MVQGGDEGQNLWRSYWINSRQ